MGIVKAENLTFEYIRRDEDGNVEGITKAVDNVSIDIKEGTFTAILGHNGSGKSTFAKHINALLYPTEGTLWVDGLDTSDSNNTMNIRQTAQSIGLAVFAFLLRCFLWIVNILWYIIREIVCGVFRMVINVMVFIIFLIAIFGFLLWLLTL